MQSKCYLVYPKVLVSEPILFLIFSVNDYPEIVHNQYRTPANVYLNSLLVNYVVIPRNKWKNTAAQTSGKCLLKPSGRHTEQPTIHNCKGPIYGFNEVDIERWPVMCQFNYQLR